MEQNTTRSQISYEELVEVYAQPACESELSEPPLRDNRRRQRICGIAKKYNIEPSMLEEVVGDADLPRNDNMLNSLARAIEHRQNILKSVMFRRGAVPEVQADTPEENIVAEDD